MVCSWGQLNVAKWLLKIKPDIDISAENDHAFREACKNGHLQIAKWLLEIKQTKINMHSGYGLFGMLAYVGATGKFTYISASYRFDNRFLICKITCFDNKIIICIWVIK